MSDLVSYAVSLAFEMLKLNSFVTRDMIELLKSYSIVVDSNLPAPAAVSTKQKTIFVNPALIHRIAEKFANEYGFAIADAEKLLASFAILHEMYHVVYDVDFVDQYTLRLLKHKFSDASEKQLKQIANVITNLFHDAFINELAVGTVFEYYMTVYDIESAATAATLVTNAFLNEFVFASSLPNFINDRFGSLVKADASKLVRPMIEAPADEKWDAMLKSIKALVENMELPEQTNLKPVDIIEEGEEKGEKGKHAEQKEADKEEKQKRSARREPGRKIGDLLKKPARVSAPRPEKGGGFSPERIIGFMNNIPSTINSKKVVGLKIREMILELAHSSRAELTPMRYTPKDIAIRKAMTRRLKGRVPKMYALQKQKASAIFVIIDVSGSVSELGIIPDIIGAVKHLSKQYDIYLVPFSSGASVITPKDINKLSADEIYNRVMELEGGGTLPETAVEQIGQTIKKDRIRPPYSYLFISDFIFDYEPSTVPPGPGWLYAAGVIDETVKKYTEIARKMGLKVRGFYAKFQNSDTVVFKQCC